MTNKEKGYTIDCMLYSIWQCWSSDLEILTDPMQHIPSTIEEVNTMVKTLRTFMKEKNCTEEMLHASMWYEHCTYLFVKGL